LEIGYSRPAGEVVGERSVCSEAVL